MVIDDIELLKEALELAKNGKPCDWKDIFEYDETFSAYWIIRYTLGLGFEFGNGFGSGNGHGLGLESTAINDLEYFIEYFEEQFADN